MAGTVCALRGGPSSAATVSQAVKVAKETGEPLYFLYVVNLDFLMRTGHIRVQTITEEMKEMGKFILLDAQQRAEQQGVPAQGVVRQGDVEEEIIDLCKELQAGYVVLGRPQRQTEENVFSQERLQTFVDHIEQVTGAQVIFAETEQS